MICFIYSNYPNNFWDCQQQSTWKWALEPWFCLTVLLSWFTTANRIWENNVNRIIQLFLLGIEVWISSRSFAVLFNSVFFPWFFSLFHCTYWLQTICCECSPLTVAEGKVVVCWGGWAKALLLSNPSPRAAPKTHKASTDAQVLLFPSFGLSVHPTRTVVRGTRIACNQGKEAQNSLHFFPKEQL